MSTEPVPQRLSDADRDAAAELLRGHFEAGRLDEAEFAERMGAALSARFAADMVPLFRDLPEPHPSLPGATDDRWRSGVPRSGQPQFFTVNASS